MTPTNKPTACQDFATDFLDSMARSTPSRHAWPIHCAYKFTLTSFPQNSSMSAACQKLFELLSSLKVVKHGQSSKLSNQMWLVMISTYCFSFLISIGPIGMREPEIYQRSRNNKSPGLVVLSDLRNDTQKPNSIQKE